MYAKAFYNYLVGYKSTYVRGSLSLRATHCVNAFIARSRNLHFALVEKRANHITTLLLPLPLSATGTAVDGELFTLAQ